MMPMEQGVAPELWRALQEAFARGQARDPVVASLELPPDAGRWVSRGLHAFVRGVQGFRFHPDSLARLRRDPALMPPFLEHLRGLRGAVDIFGVAEGEIVTSGTPVLELHGPLIEAVMLLPAARLHLETPPQRRLRGLIAPHLLPLPGLEPGRGPCHVYRLLAADGRALEDQIVPRGTPPPEDARSLLQRWADRGHPCRPLPDARRVEALHARALYELAERSIEARELR